MSAGYKVYCVFSVLPFPHTHNPHDSLAEIEEYQLRIASDEKVMQQIFSVAFTPTFKFGPSMVAIGTLDNLSSQ